jgi:hypothetical protein
MSEILPGLFSMFSLCMACGTVGSVDRRPCISISWPAGDVRRPCTQYSYRLGVFSTTMQSYIASS